MALTITLAKRATGPSTHAGIVFTDGVAIVPELGPNTRAFLATLGAEIRDGNAPTTAADVHALTIAEIRHLASQHRIDLPSRAKHDELADAVAAALFPSEE